MFIMGKNVIEKILHADGMCGVRFCGEAIPEVVEFGKTGFEKEMGVDLEEGGGGAVAVIAGVDGDFSRRRSLIVGWKTEEEEEEEEGESNDNKSDKSPNVIFAVAKHLCKGEV